MRIVMLVLAALALAVAAPAVADKGGNPNGGGNSGENGNKGGNGSGGGHGGSAGSSTLTLVVLDPDDGGANYGEQVTFEVSTSVTNQPHVSATCSQNGVLVYSASVGFYEGYPWPWAQVFTLRSSSWTSGPAECTAALEYWDGRRFRELASVEFDVLA